MAIESYVVVHNITKRHNVGTLARSATVFEVNEVILVGRLDFNASDSHGSTAHLRFCHFHSLIDSRLFLKEKDCDICGVEITDGAFSRTDHPFKKSTAFLLCNEYGGGTASLNVTVAASIVLHHFGGIANLYLILLYKCLPHAVWAGFSERIRDGNKFVVAERPLKQVSRKYCSETDDCIIEERKSVRESASNGFFDDGKMVYLLVTFWIHCFLMSD
ncbi:hypothetical protein CRYUN_Cryun40dG0022200 [Craigia yunnanensis]